MDIPLMKVGELLPDHPDRENPGLLRAENVTPGTNAYYPIRDLKPDYDALPSRCRGAGPVKDLTGQVMNFAGDNDALYELSGNAYADVSKSGGYDLSNAHFWTFLGFNGYAFAVGGYEPLQQFDEGGSGAFGDIVPNPDGTLDPAPQALYGAVVRQFIMTGNQTLNAKEVVWSGLNDHTMWVAADGNAAAANQAGRQTLQDGGDVTQVVGGEYGVIFCEHAIYRAEYEGSPIVFSFDNVAPGKGTVAPGSVANVGHDIYYLDVDGFYRFSGSSSEPIGSNRVNQTFLDDYNSEYPKSVDSLVDLENTTVFWSYVSHSASIAGVPDKLMAYNWSTQQFSGPIHMTTEQLVYSLTPGVNSDEAPVAGTNTDTGIYAEILSDAGQFKGGGRAVMAAFDANHQHATTSGANLTALIETGSIAINPQGYAMVQGIRPVIEGDAPNMSAAIGHSNDTFGQPVWTADVSPHPRTGLANFRVNSRYQRIRLTVSGDYDKIVGFEAQATPMGRQ